MPVLPSLPFELLFKSLTDCVFVVEHGRIVFANDAAERLLGWTAVDLVGKNAVDVLPVEVHEVFRAFMRRPHDPESEHGLLHLGTLQDREGHAIPVEASISAVGREGRTVYTAVLRDTRGRAHGTTEILSARRSFASIAEVSTLGMAVVTSDDELLYANPAARRLLGHSLADLLGKPLGFGTSETGRAEVDHGGGGEERKVISCRWSPIEWGRKAALLVMLDDVTDVRRAEEALRRSEESHRKLIEGLPYAIVVHRNNMIVLVNQAFARTLGYLDPSELINKPIHSVVHPDDLPRFVQRQRRLLEFGQPLPVLEERLLRRNGTPVTVEMSALLITIGGQPHIAAVAQESTGTRLMAEQLRSPKVSA